MYLFRQVVLFFLLVICYPQLDLYGQKTQSITKISIADGLSNSSVGCIFQDKKGFMWFGTFDGLNRYDGYDFKVFRNKFRDTSSLQHNYIYSITEDSEENIWVGTGQGLMKLDPITNDFHRVLYRRKRTDKAKYLNYNINVLKTDSKGNIFIGTNNAGLFFKPYNSDICIELPFFNSKEYLTNLDCRSMAIGSDKKVWIFLSNIGLCYYDYTSKQIKLANDSIKYVNCINAQDPESIWLGTTNGLFNYSLIQKRITNSYRAAKGQLLDNNVLSLLTTKDHKLYIGTDGDGICILQQHSNTFTYIHHGERSGELEGGVIMDLYQDNESRIWIATLRGGIGAIDDQRNAFQTFRHEHGVEHSLVNNFTSAFCESDKNHLWVGTEDGGISLLNRKTGQFTNYTHSPDNKTSLSSNAVTCIIKDHLNKVWISTYSGGINRFDPKTQSFDHFECKNPLTGNINKDILFLYEDSRKNLWAGGLSGNNLYKFDRAKGKFLLFDPDFYDPYTIFEDHTGQLWCGTAGDLVKLDTLNKQHTYYDIDKPIRSIYEDHAGHLWLGTEGGGLCLFDRRSNSITRRFTDADGLSSNGVLNVLEDRSGRLWLSTFQGLTCFNFNDLTTQNYYASDGLQSNQFSFNAALSLRSGELAFGGINGFNIFYPDSIIRRDFMPTLVFTNISVDNKKIAEENVITKNDGTRDLKGLKVPYDKAVFSFSFAALEFSSPQHIKYMYYLKGLDKRWLLAGNERTINYNNVPDGRYTLHIRSTNGIGEWNKKDLLLDLIVTPPWFRTWWAYLFYLILVIAGIWAFIRYRASRLLLEYQISLERTNLEKEQELSFRKTTFFTNVSHEFRTPLMLIINPLQEVMARSGKDNFAELGIVYRNARRLLSLIDQLLLFNQAEINEIDIQVRHLNFHKLCRSAYESFVYQASAKNIKYEFIAEAENIALYGDNAKLEVILYNLLSNAFRFTKNGGSITFSLSESAGHVQASIADNGYGISPEIGNHLFEKFYRSPNQESLQKSGFGIGLYLVDQFVKLHAATIAYESELGKGTTFFVNFKKGKEHFQNISISEEKESESVFLDELSGDQELSASEISSLSELTAIAEIEDRSSKDEETDHWSGKTVSGMPTMLIIDDHPDMRTYLKQIFKDRFSLIEAADGNQGIQMAKEYVPNVIISDIMMEEKDGLELCNDIKSNPSLTHIPIILITASSSQEIRLKGIKFGADDYFSKPLNKDLLVARIDALLNNRDNLQNYFYRKVTHNEQNVKISEQEKIFIDNCIAIIESRLDDDAFNVDEFAKALYMSRSNLFIKIKAVSNQTPNSFIKFVRLRRAAELFINSSYNVNEVSGIVGFSDMKYFREQFFQLFGLNPSEYIKKYRDPFSKKMALHPGIKRAN